MYRKIHKHTSIKKGRVESVCACPLVSNISVWIEKEREEIKRERLKETKPEDAAI